MVDGYSARTFSPYLAFSPICSLFDYYCLQAQRFFKLLFFLASISPRLPLIMGGYLHYKFLFFSFHLHFTFSFSFFC